MAKATTRVAAGRRATPASPSIRGGARIELARPLGPSVFETAAVAGHRLVPPRTTLYVGQDSNLHAREGPWSTARRASQLPNRRMCRSAGIPDVSAVGRCGDRKPLPSCGSGSCLMLSTIEFALTPHRWGLSRERYPHGHVTVSPVPRCSPASRPGRGSGARGTFHDSHGRRESNPQPPVLETGALPVELRPLAVVELCAPAVLARPREPRPEMQKGRSVRLRILGPGDPWTSASAGAARHVPVLDGTYMGDSSWLGSH